MKVMKKIALVVASALVYYLFFYFNKIFFDSLEFSYGVNWIFIPSGIQFLLVLVAIGEGALGIVLASFFIGLENYYLDSAIRTFITSLISGFSPLLARKICFDFLGVERELLNITAKAIFQMSFVFAILSASLHQIWFFYNDKTQDFIQSLLVMTVGNLLGTVLVLAIVNVFTFKFKNNNSSQD